MEHQSRYVSQSKGIYDFMDTFVVHCPKCQKKAEVKLPFFMDYKNATLNCAACFFFEKMFDRKIYKLNGKVKCSFCLEWLCLDIEHQKKIPKYVNIRCSSCQKVNKVHENWDETYLKYHEEGIVDPAFGLPLWYVDEVKGAVIWAYNKAHLEEIEAYVSSKLRERSTDGFKMTMVEKLPNFIKIAKNREEVLKALDRMKNK